MKYQWIRMRIAGLLLLAAGEIWAQQVGWPQCPEVSEDDFIVERIVTREKDKAHSPIKIDFHQVGEYTNFYFNELRGRVRYYDEATNSVTDVGRVKGYFRGQKDVFSGLTLDPDFEKNRRIYLYYSCDGFYRMARYRITEDNKLDQSSELVYFDIPKNNDDWHSAGAMDFDADGDLWIAVGDNQQYSAAALATKNYLGSILRIHPDDSPRGYSIPAGNMGPYWSGRFEEMGIFDLAAEYADTGRVLPEIYAKGVRNPYTLKVVHPIKKWIVFGDVGPDGFGGNTEEFELLQEPGFLGWAVWAGEKGLKNWSDGIDVDHDGITKVGEKVAKGGASGLPPINDAEYNILQASAQSGPIYWYDGNLKSDRKFPAYYHGKWFVADNNETAWDGPPWVRVLTMNQDYTEVDSVEDFFGFTKERIQELYFGPDGAMYIAYFYRPWFGDSKKNEIVRISYNREGNENCLPGPELVPPFPTVSARGKKASPAPKMRFTALDEFRLSGWKGAVQLFDVLGNEVPLRNDGNGVYRLPGRLSAGVYFLKAGTERFMVSNINAH